MFKHGFPPEWSTFKKLIWLVGTGIAGAASGIWKTVTGTLIHLTDALASPMQKCEVSLEPIQDLHGQDAPYPAGCGANKWDEVWKDGTINANTGGNYDVSPSSVRSDTFCPCEANTTYYTSFRDNSLYVRIFWYASDYSYLGYAALTTGSRYKDVSPANAKYFKIAVVGEYGTTYKNDIAITLTDTHTYSPYENICPITGWTGCEVTRLGANILPYPYVDSSVTRSGITFTVNNDYTVTVNGTASNDAVFELCRTYPYSNDELVLGKTIKLTGCPQNGSQSTYYLSAVITGHKDTGNGVSFTINNVGYFRFAIVIKSGVTVNNLIFKPMVVVGTEQQDYEHYSGTTASVTFPAKGKNLLNVDELALRNSTATNLRNCFYFTGTGTYTVSASATISSIISARVKSASGTYGTSTVIASSSTYTSATYTLSEGETLIVFEAEEKTLEYSKEEFLTAKIQLEEGSSATTYEPYTNTVYGGTVDLVSGELAATWASADISTFFWGYVSASNTFRANELKNIIKPPSTNNKLVNARCSIFKIVSAGSVSTNNLSIGCNVEGSLVLKYDAANGDRETLVELLNGVQFVYELSEPIVYQLPPQPISTLAGENNVWGSGNIELTYKAQAE